MKSLYSSPQSKTEILSLYQNKLDSLSIEYRTKMILTSFGETSIIITGDSNHPPLVLVHGSNGCAPIALDIYPKLSQKYQVFAVDVLAQPNKSAETRLSMKDNSYGHWLNETINKLNLKQVTLAGFSLGGLVILKTLLQEETNIKKAFLIAPAFIVNGNPFKAIFKIFLPMQLYMKTKRMHYLKKFLKALFSEQDDFALEFLAKVFLHFEMDFSPVPTIKSTEAQRIQTPIILIAAQQDIIFPGSKMLKRAKKIFPSLKKTVLLNNSKHVQNKQDNTRVELLILED